jgi:hypothetical protein
MQRTSGLRRFDAKKIQKYILRDEYVSISVTIYFSFVFWGTSTHISIIYGLICNVHLYAANTRRKIDTLDSVYVCMHVSIVSIVYQPLTYVCMYVCIYVFMHVLARAHDTQLMFECVHACQYCACTQYVSL